MAVMRPSSSKGSQIVGLAIMGWLASSSGSAAGFRSMKRGERTATRASPMATSLSHEEVGACLL